MARAAGVASLVALTDLDEHEAAILLDAAGGDVEMAVSLHFGDQADEDLYWSDEEADRLLDEELKRGAQEKTAEFINRVQTREQVAKSAADSKKRDRKSRSKLRSAEAEALLKSADVADTRRASGCDAQSPPQEFPAARMASAGGGSGFSALAEHDSSGASAAESDEDSDSSRDSSSSEEWVDEDW